MGIRMSISIVAITCVLLLFVLWQLEIYAREKAEEYCIKTIENMPKDVRNHR